MKADHLLFSSHKHSSNTSISSHNSNTDIKLGELGERGGVVNLKVSKHSTNRMKERRGWMRTQCRFMFKPSWIKAVLITDSLILFPLPHVGVRTLHIQAVRKSHEQQFPKSILVTGDDAEMISGDARWKTKICEMCLFSGERWQLSNVERRCEVSAAGWLLLWQKHRWFV